MPVKLYWLHTLSPTHLGTGRGVGYIDLPIDRDGVTGWPVIRGSSFKGVWADYYQATPDNRQQHPELRAAFGVASDEKEASNAGALIPTDARLVCLPVRSFKATFAWCTSPLCLQMLHRMLQLAGVNNLPDLPNELSENQALHTKNTATKEGEKIYLEDLDFSAQESKEVGEWAEKIAQWVFPEDEKWQNIFKERFLVIPDAAFDFLCKTATEVRTRVRIDDETKTVATSALWTEEALPAETILAGIIKCDRIFGPNGKQITCEKLLQHYATGEILLQIGGKATVGLGQVRCIFTPVEGDR